MRIAIWFSCGAASAIAAKKTVELYGDEHELRLINSPIAEEHPDNRRFAMDVAEWVGLPLEYALNPKFPDYSCVSVWAKRKFMSSPMGAPCTVELKKVARQIWEAENEPDQHVLGFTYEEKARYDRFVLTERDNVLPVLIENKITKPMCYEMIAEAGIRLPMIYRRGYPNANCIGCVKASSPTYWNHVREMDPDVFEERAKQSREIGARLVRVNGERVFLDELDPNAKGQPLQNMDVECGLFCEEHTG